MNLLNARWFSVVICLSITMLAVVHTRAAGYQWIGVNSTDWFDAGNWADDTLQPGVPGTGDTARIEAGAVLLTNTTASLAAFTLSGGTLTCSNWTTRLNAADVILAGGTITLPPAFRETEMSNRVWIVCSNLTMDAGGVIDVNGGGFSGGDWNTSGHGPGKGIGSATGTRAGGAGYGGAGGFGFRPGNGWYQRGGGAYGLAAEAEQPGSGGGGPGYATYYGGDGGGAVRIEAVGDVVLDGIVTANGTAGSKYGGGGSGGGIFISCVRFNGNGAIRANGGTPGLDGGGGGGGRVSITYATLLGPPSVRIETKEAVGALTRWHALSRLTNRWMSAYGTIAFSDTNMLSRTLTNYYGTIVVPGFDRWAPESLAISNGLVGFEPGFRLEVAGDLDIGPAAALELPRDSFLRCDGDLRVSGGRLWMNSCTQLVCDAGLAVTDGGAFYSYAPPARGGVRYGMSVDVAGELRVGGNSWILPTTDLTNGAPVRFRCARLAVDATGGFDADGRGLSGAAYFVYNSYKGWGDGGGMGSYNAWYGSGGGYGGAGGWSWRKDWDAWHVAGGPSYGSSNVMPVAGSGGGTLGTGSGGHGGGMIWIEVAEQARMDGRLSASGGLPLGSSGGGAGGGIVVVAPRFTGAETAVLRADGSNPGGTYGGPGGGGRVVVAVGLSVQERGKLLAGQPIKKFSMSHPAYEGDWSVGVGVGPDYTDEEWRTPLPGTFLFLKTFGGTQLMIR